MDPRLIDRLNSPVPINLGRALLITAVFLIVVGIGIFRVETNRAETGRQGIAIEELQRVLANERAKSAADRARDRRRFRELVEELVRSGELPPGAAERIDGRPGSATRTPGNTTSPAPAPRPPKRGKRGPSGDDGEDAPPSAPAPTPPREPSSPGRSGVCVENPLLPVCLNLNP